jgi:hypothetical protein
MSPAEIYPNAKPRLINNYNLKHEGKTINCLGPEHRGTEWGDLVEVWTKDTRGVNELHLFRIADLTP